MLLMTRVPLSSNVHVTSSVVVAHQRTSSADSSDATNPQPNWFGA